MNPMEEWLKQLITIEAFIAAAKELGSLTNNKETARAWAEAGISTLNLSRDHLSQAIKMLSDGLEK